MKRGVPDDRALQFWQSRTKRVLSTEDARGITSNVCGFFRILKEWHANDNAEDKEMKNPTTKSPRRGREIRQAAVSDSTPHTQS